MNNIKN